MSGASPIARAACLASLASLAVTVAACTDDGAQAADDEAGQIPSCVELEFELDGCSALYPPTYDQVWTQTLGQSCAGVGSACHAQSDAAGALNGATFVDAQQTWEHLTLGGAGGDQALVEPGDPLCSPLFVRLATDDPDIRMPPGTSGLGDGTLCSIATWIADGATYQAP